MKTFTTFKVSNFKFVLSQYALCVLLMLTMGIGNAWGKTWTWTVYVAVANGTGGTAKGEIFKSGAFGRGGSVEKTTGDVSSSTLTSVFSTEDNRYASFNYYHHYIFTATPYDGYSFGGWYTSSNVSGNPSSTSNQLTGGNDNDGFNETRYAKFTPVTVSSAGNADAISFNHPETKTVTLYFPVSDNADANADFNAPTISGTGWSVSSWSLNTSTHKVEVVCSFEANSDVAKGSYNATVTLTAKSNNSNTGTVTANVDLTPTLTFDNGSCDISVSDDDKTTLNVANLKTAYKGADDVAGDGAITYSLKTANSNVSLTSDGIFYAKATGTYTIVASATKGRYYAKTAEFTITVGKRTPTFSWRTFANIYAGDELENLAQAQYNGNNITSGLTYTYSVDNDDAAYVDGTTIKVKTTFTSNQEARVSVTTEETDFYEAGSGYYDYLIEPKATPLFKLNDVDLPESPIKRLDLKVGETANMTFVGTDESNNQFTYPTGTQYVSYIHNSEARTGVITGTVAGDEVIQFHQTGTNTIFDHTRSIHVYVSKHEVTLSSPLAGQTYHVDDLIDFEDSYSITPAAGTHPQEEVLFESSNESVVKLVDGKIRALGEGEADLTFRMANNAYWTGDIIVAHVNIIKYDPVITWNMESSYPWGAVVETPVSSSNEELPFTVESNNPSVADYVNGKIEVYNTGDVTFTLSQGGNYKWNAAATNLTKQISCYQPDNHVPFTIGSGNKGDIVIYNESHATWDNNGYKMGGGNWILSNAPDAYIIIGLTGIPDKLTFTKKCDKSVGQLPVDGDCLFEVYESTTNGNWGDPIWSYNQKEESRDVTNVPQLKPSTRYIKLRYYGTVYGHFNNIHISQRKEIVADADQLTFATAPVDATAQTLSVKVDWYNVKACNVTITGTNAEFFTLVEGSESIASSLDHFGDKTLSVKYAYPESGTHTATLHIESLDGYYVNVDLEATSTKLTPSIQWKENLSPMARGENVENPATSPVTLVYESSDPTVVEVEGNTLKPLKKGNATITASFDGTTDKKWESVSDTYDVLVTDMKVLHINWPQTFTRLKYSAEDPTKTTADFALNATVSYFDPDTKEEIDVDRAVSFTSSNNAVVQVLTGNILHVAGTGTTSLIAHVDGVENEFIEANVTRAVKVREPSTDCDTYILEDAHNSMLTEINSFNGVETVYELNEEPGYLTFSAWTEKWYLGKIGIDPSGDMKVAQYINGEWSDAIWSNSLQVGNEQSFGPLELDRRATKIKFYKEVGSTCYHNFSEGYVTLARYVELENTKGKTSMDLNFSTADAKPGVPAVKTFTVNYSNITDQLVLDYEGSDKFTVLSPSSIGEECGDKGTATVQVQFLSHDVDHYEGTLTIHNANQSVTINLSADVDKHSQHIEWTPETQNLKTTDEVTFDATTSGSSAGLSVRYSVTAGNDVATVNANTGKLTILTEGDVTVQADADGNNTTYYAAEPVSYTFNISKVKPTIITAPTAATMTMPNTTLSGCALNGGEATVAGTFAWDDNTISATLNNTGYKVNFTPENTNWYDMTSCVVVVPVNKQINEITWNFNQLEMYCNAEYTFDATASSGLTVAYATSDNSIAYVDGDNKLRIIKGGEVTITASQEGDDDYAAAEPIAKTLNILREKPTVVTYPTALAMKIGKLLSDASLTGGRAELNGVKSDGSFAWKNGNTQVENVAGDFSRIVVFTPANSNYYDTVEFAMTVSVEKYAPVINSALQGSTIVYGQALSNSTISGSIVATDNVKVPSVAVEGNYAWKDGSAIVNAGNPTQATAVFTPNNTDWYMPVEFDVPLTVTPAIAPEATATASIYYGQVLGEATLANTTAGIVGGIVNGVASWDESLDLSQYYTVGTHNLPIRFMPNDPNYEAVEVSGTAVLTVEAGYVFNGANGPSWSEDGNWTNNTKPGVDDPVVIMADVVITTPITAGGITISNGVNVTVKNGGKLTLGDEDSFVRSGYGNLTIEAGGEVDMGEGKLKVNDFAIETTMASGKSGQLNGATASNFAAAGEAYIDITLGAAGKRAEQWHAFTVPFPVDALNGIYDAETGDKLVNEVNYAIMDYHGDIRATGKYGWKKYRKTLVPGTFYIMTVDGERTTYRFKKKAGAALIAENSKETFEYAKSGDGQDIDAGWNGIGNPTLQYGKVNVPVQVLDPEAYEYVTKTAGSTNFVVGTPFFYKAGADGSIMMQTADAGAYYAPARRTVREIKDVDITFGNEAYKDHLYISASEDALDSYEQDKDLVKMRMSKTPKVAQIMAKAYGCELSIVNAPMVNGEARYALSLYAPAAGEYTISSDAMALAEDGSQLYLTYNGYPMWNLTSSPMTVTLPKGNSTQFGLKIVRSNAMPTEIEEVTGNGLRVTGAEKMIMDGKLFILRDGVLYDGTGRRVR